MAEVDCSPIALILPTLVRSSSETDPVRKFLTHENNFSHKKTEILPTAEGDVTYWVYQHKDHGTDGSGKPRYGMVLTKEGEN